MGDTNLNYKLQTELTPEPESHALDYRSLMPMLAAHLAPQLVLHKLMLHIPSVQVSIITLWFYWCVVATTQGSAKRKITVASIVLHTSDWKRCLIKSGPIRGRDG